MRVGGHEPDEQVAAAVARLDVVAGSPEAHCVRGFAVAVAHEGELVYVRAFGVRDIGQLELALTAKFWDQDDVGTVTRV